MRNFAARFQLDAMADFVKKKPMNFNSESNIVLVVDDVPENLAVLHDALDESGYTVLVANNGETALIRAAEAQPHIILLDAVMPGMDGFDTCRHLKPTSPRATSRWCS
jgi:CheY-like chemotaxis protein